MNENHALLFIVGAVIAVGVVGMFWVNYDYNRLTGLSNVDLGTITTNIDEEATLTFTSDTLDFTVSNLNGLGAEEGRINSEGTCVNVDTSEPCTIVVDGGLNFDVTGSAEYASVDVKANDVTPLGVGSSVYTKIVEVPTSDPLTAQCYAMTGYTLLAADDTNQDAIYWTPTNSDRTFDLEVQEEFVIIDTVGSSSFTITATATPQLVGDAPPGCMVDIPVP